jgi:hypothetical protein
MKKTDYDEETYYKKVEQDLFPLILMTHKFEEFISDYALMKTEDRWDEEFDTVVRAFFFGKGTQEYIISITPEGLIRRHHTTYPAQLAIQVHNVIAGMYAGGWLPSSHHSGITTLPVGLA